MEATLDDELTAAGDGASCAQFGEQELDYVLGLTVHLFANVANVGKDRSLVAFAKHLRRRERVLLRFSARLKSRVRSVQQAVESTEELLLRGQLSHRTRVAGC